MRPESNKAYEQWVAAYEADLAGGHSPRLEEQQYLDLIHYYEELGQLPSGRMVAELALEHYPYSADLHLRLAALLLEDCQFGDALHCLERAESLGVSGLEPLLIRVEAYCRSKRFAAAAHFLDEQLSLDNTDARQADLLVAQALLFEHQLAFERMYMLLRAALDLEPAHEMALEKIGAAVEMTKQYAESIQLHRSILDKHPYSAQAWFNLGQAYLFSGHYERAVEALEYAFITDPRFELAYHEYIDLCLELRQYDKVLQGYEDLTQHFVLEIEDWLKIGQCYLHQHNFKKADEVFRHALEEDPFNDELLFFLGECLAAQEEWYGAIHYYNKAVELQDQQEEYFAARGESYFHLGQMEAAEADFRRAILLAPEAGPYWLQYTSFLMESGRLEQALTVFEEAEEQVDSTELLYGRVACLLALGQRQEAIYRLGEALNQNYDGYGLLYELIPDLEKDSEIASLITSYSF